MKFFILRMYKTYPLLPFVVSLLFALCIFYIVFGNCESLNYIISGFAYNLAGPQSHFRSFVIFMNTDLIFRPLFLGVASLVITVALSIILSAQHRANSLHEHVALLAIGLSPNLFVQIAPVSSWVQLFAAWFPIVRQLWYSDASNVWSVSNFNVFHLEWMPYVLFNVLIYLVLVLVVGVLSYCLILKNIFSGILGAAVISTALLLFFFLAFIKG